MGKGRGIKIIYYASTVEEVEREKYLPAVGKRSLFLSPTSLYTFSSSSLSSLTSRVPFGPFTDYR